MFKRLLLICSICAMATTAKAQCTPAYPFTFSNGTIADANQVMSNFNAVLTCASPNANITGGTIGGVLTLGVTGQSRMGATGWLTAISPGTEANSQVTSLLNSTVGGYGLIGAGRTSDTALTTTGVFGIGGFGICNNSGTAVNRSCWAYYGEGWRFASTADQYTHVAEFDAINLATAVANGPYNIAPQGIDPNLWLSCGKPGVSSTTNCTAAIGIINNGNPYINGIVFQSNALQGNDGTTGTATAILMPKGDAIVWQAAGSVTGPSIRSDVSSSNSGMNVIFGNGAIFAQSHDGSSINFSISDVASATHYITMVANNGGTADITTNAGDLGLTSASGNVAVQGTLLLATPAGQAPGDKALCYHAATAQVTISSSGSCT